MTARQTLPLAGILCSAFCTASRLPAQQTSTPLQIVTTTLPAAQMGSPYNQQIATSGGNCAGTLTSTPSSTIDAGALPPGISVTSPASTKQWFLQGTPTAAGNFTFTLHVYWTHVRVSPFDTACTDDATQSLTLQVQGPVATLAVSRSPIAVTYHTDQFPPPPDVIQVTASTATTFTTQAATDAGGAWLSVSPASANTPANISLTYSTGGLAPGTYTGRVILSAGSATLTIPVSLSVVTDTGVAVGATPTALSFSAAPGGADPAAQNLAITLPGNAVIFQATVMVSGGAKWLSVSPTAALTPAQLTVTASAKGLAAAVYTGSIVLAVNGATNSVTTVPVTFTVQAPVTLPAITANGVVNAASSAAAIAPGTWVSLFGTALSATTRAWRTADFVNGILPLSLDGVSVTINGKAAAIAFISPAQVNALATDDSTTGLVPVVVKNSAGASPAALTLLQTIAPGFFQFPGNYVAATHADGSNVAGSALVKLGVPGTPAAPGETIVLYGSGFGATQPAISATGPVSAPLPLVVPTGLTIRIAGVDTQVMYAGLISPGLYQFNVVVPQVPDGDVLVSAEMRGLLSQPGLFLSVQH
jgi:uncharacterized protein (TIGR03437 family)